MNEYFKYSELKKDVSLPKLMEANGFQMVKGKTSRRQLVFGSGIEYYVVERNDTGQWKYFIASEPAQRSEQGKQTMGLSNLDFVMSIVPGISLRQAGEILFRFKQTGNFSTGEHDILLESSKTDNEYVSNLIKQRMKPVGKFAREYFTARGLDPNLLDTMLRGQFYEWQGTWAQLPRHNSVATVMRAQDGIPLCALSSAIGRKTYASGSQANALWYVTQNAEQHPDGTPNRKKFMQAFIGESWQDVLAYYQLNQDRLQNESLLLMSSQGNLSESQTAFVKRLIDDKIIDNLTTIFDNDTKGISYAAKIANECYPQDNVSITLLPFKDQVRCSIKNVSMYNADFEQAINTFFADFNPIKTDKGIEINIDQQAGNIQVRFKSLINSIKDFKQIKNLKIQFPNEKDYNDELIVFQKNIKENKKNDENLSKNIVPS